MDSIFEALKKLGPARLAILMATLLGLILFLVFIAARSSSPSMTLLYNGLSTSDSTEITAKLDLSRIRYSLSDDGSEVRVNRDDVGRARILLAEEGLPRGGSMGYEIFDQKQGFGTTNFVQNLNQLRALEGELARTVMAIDTVRTARVHIVMPERQLFSRDTRPATASVFVSLRNGQNLSAEQIMSVRHLVSASVPQLKPGAVAIIDSSGALLARADDAQNEGNLTPNNTEEMRQKFERRMTQTVEDIVGRIVGYGKVRASISADLDFSVLTRNSEIYDPEGQVVRSTQSVSDEQSDTTGGGNQAVTVENNLPGLPGAGGTGGGGGISSTRSEEVTNFEISKSVESLIRESGEVQKLSIAVLVDGKYETAPPTADAAADAATAEPVTAYVPRTQAELDQIAALVKSAVGFDESRGDKIEVVNMQFAPIDMAAADTGDLIFGLPKQELLSIAETLTLSIVAVLIILLVLRPLVSHIATMANSTSQTGGGDGATPEQLALLTQGGMNAPQLMGPGGMPQIGSSGGGAEEDIMIDMNQVEGRIKASAVQRISEIVSSHPNETVSVIRSWMSQENQ